MSSDAEAQNGRVAPVGEEEPLLGGQGDAQQPSGKALVHNLVLGRPLTLICPVVLGLLAR